MRKAGPGSVHSVSEKEGVTERGFGRREILKKGGLLAAADALVAANASTPKADDGEEGGDGDDAPLGVWHVEVFSITYPGNQYNDFYSYARGGRTCTGNVDAGAASVGQKYSPTMGEYARRCDRPQASASSPAILPIRSMAGASVLALVAVLTATASTFAKPNRRRASPAIRVWVLNYAQARQKMLERAEGVTAGVLKLAGIQVNWVNCPAPECRQPHLPADLAVRILSQSMADLQSASKDALGCALVPSPQAPSDLASVFYDRAKSLAGALGVAQDEILGYVMAHELGHLLLRSSGHAPFGIMRVHWTREDLLSRLTFMPAEAQLMRANISVRKFQEPPRIIAAPEGRQRLQTRSVAPAEL